MRAKLEFILLVSAKTFYCELMSIYRQYRHLIFHFSTFNEQQ